jgi:hypothetical protein
LVALTGTLPPRNRHGNVVWLGIIPASQQHSSHEFLESDPF